MKVLTQIEPKEVMSYFEEICQIPRRSGEEKAISDYLTAFGKNLKLETIQDEALNVIIKKPGTVGYENAPTVIIQGHTDMVCEKNQGTEHDFEKDPLKLRVIDDFIYATDTTLGADNGIAVAYAMALLASNSIPHPPLEVVLTSDEETGMSGAMGVSSENVKGKILINIDNEVEGQILVSCAGGVRTKAMINIDFEEPTTDEVVEISIRGLKGGHSGIEIHNERGNSNKIIGRILKDILDTIDIRIISLNGGSKDNAIPREADVKLHLNKSDLNKLNNLIEKWQGVLSNELQHSDPDVKVSVNVLTEKVNKVFTKDCTERVINLLFVYPNGVNTRSVVIEDLVESSTNIGVLTTTDEKVILESAVRSSVKTLKENIVERMTILAKAFGAEIDIHASYPEWQYIKDSKLRDVAKEVHVDMFGKEPEIVAIHAGVECGILNEKLGDLDMISIGPNLYDIHTPQEHMSISSVKNTWEYLKAILEQIK